jgi:hypothetical protein
MGVQMCTKTPSNSTTQLSPTQHVENTIQYNTTHLENTTQHNTTQHNTFAASAAAGGA